MWGLITFLLGILYGWVLPGRENKSRLFVNGLVLGIVLALVLTFIGASLGAPALPLGAGIVAIILGVVILTLVFILGAWIGDMLEPGRTGPPRRI